MIEIGNKPTSEQAEILLAFIRLKAQCDDRIHEREGWITVEHYTNCREQGYALIIHCNPHKRRQVCFAENRNSDNIVVLFGTDDDFEHNTNIPRNAAVYECRKYFNCHDFNGATSFILDYLLDGKYS